MKKIIALSALMASLSFAGVSAQAATNIVNGGTVHFTGSVVNAACAVDANSVNQTVQMGQVKSSTLNGAGKTSSKVPFNIQLDDCDLTVSTLASVGFSGVAVNSANPTVLSLDSSAAGNATNVGIQILDRTGAALGLDGNTFGATTTLSTGTNLIPFEAQYYATGAATAGNANGQANFKVQYQ